MPATSSIGPFHYAGIGSRETPDYYQNIMTSVSTYLESEGWIMRSGAAKGADIAFESGIQETRHKEIYLPWAGYNNSGSSLNPRNYPFSQQEQDFTAHFHPEWNKCSPSARLLHQRNTRIMLGCEAIHGPIIKASLFVVCWQDPWLKRGGTRQALRIAEAHGIPVFNLGETKTKTEIEQMLLAMDALQTTIKGEIT